VTCTVVGAGLVGCFLGAAAGAVRAVCGPRGRPAGNRIRLPSDRPGRWTDWRPVLVDDPGEGPALVCTRVSATPWLELPDDVLVAQNGLGQPRRCCACFFALDADSQGLIHLTGPAPRLVLEDPGPRWAPVLAAWRRAGIAVEVVDDVTPHRWEKCILNATVGPLCLATGRSMSAVWADPGLRQLVQSATREGRELAAGEGIAIPEEFEARADDFFATCGDHVPSTVTDPGELPWILGHLLDRAVVQGRTCPALARIGAMVAATPAAEHR
jgi:ketopantoate reductase